MDTGMVWLETLSPTLSALCPALISPAHSPSPLLSCVPVPMPPCYLEGAPPMDMHLLCFLIPEPSRTHMDHLMGDASVSPSHICMLSRCLGWGSVVLQVGVLPKRCCSRVLGTKQEHTVHTVLIPSMSHVVASYSRCPRRAGQGAGGFGIVVNVAAPKRAARDQLI